MRQGSGSEFDRESSLLGSWLRAHIENVRSLSRETLKIYAGKQVIAGWEIHPDYSPWPLYILIDEDFPHSHICIAYVGTDKFLHWPHVEKHGFLCLPKNGWRPTEDLGISAQQRINHAIKLLEDCQSKFYIRAESEREFVSYWTQISTSRLVSLINLEDPTPRVVTGCNLWGDYCIAESQDILNQWIKNQRGRNPGPTIQSIFSFIEHPPVLPMPRSSKEFVLRLADNFGDRSALLKSIDPTKDTLVIIAVRRPEGVGVIGARVHGVELHGVERKPRRRVSKRRAKKKAGKKPGFPDYHVRLIWETKSKFEALRVVRCDSNWVHGRGLDRHHHTLATSKVVLIGCGSLGSQVAARLAESGVGTIYIIDPEVLESNNVGRHELGMNNLFDAKATALASQLSSQYPHGDFQGRASTWEAIVRSEPELFDEANLIVSCVGEIEHDLAWDSFFRTRSWLAPTVYGWLGTQGTTGHALVVTSESPGLSCVFDSDGMLRFPDTQFQKSSLAKTEPGCGTDFQPYGPLAVGQVEVLVTRLCLDLLSEKATAPEHRVYACSTEDLVELGGWWTERHRTLRPSGYDGSFEYQADVATCGECPRCKAEVTS